MPEDPHEPSLSPPGPSAPGSEAAPREKRRWGRMLLKIFGVLFLLLALFHRPVIQWTLSTLLYKVAARQNVSLELDIEGSMLWNLTVKNVRALPTGKGKTPVRKIAIEYLHFEYSIPKLITGGLGEFLKSYEIRHADVDILATPSENEAEKRQKRTLADDLNNLLAQPALYADEVGVEDFNLIVQSPKDVTRLEGLHLFLHPNKPGWLRVEAVKLPNLPAWRKLSATTSYANRNLIISELELDPRINIDRLRFDASRRAENRGSLGLDAHLFGGTLALELDGRQLPQKGENLKKSYDTDLKVTAAGVNIASAVEYFSRKEIPATRLLDLKIDVRGQPERPNTWTGTVAAGVGTAALGEMTLDRIFAEAEVKDGLARITKAGLAIGENWLAITGQAQLPESVNRLRETDLQSQVKIDAPDLRDVTVGFLPEHPLHGQLTGEGTLALKDQRLSANVTLHGEKLSHPTFEVASAEIKGSISSPLKTTPGAPLEDMAGTLAAKLGAFRFRNYRADSAEVDASLKDTFLSIGKLAVISGENSITGTGQFSFPEGKAVPHPIAAQFAIKLPELSAVGVTIDEDVLAGAVEGGVALQTINGRLTGTMDLTGTTIRHGEFRARNFVAKVIIDPNEKVALNMEADAIGTNDVYVDAAKIEANSSNLIERTRVGHWQELDSDVDAVLTAPRYKKFNLDSADLAFRTADGLLKLGRLDLHRGKNTITASGSFQLLEGKGLPRPVEGQFAIDVPDLSSLEIESNREILDGRIQGKGSLFSTSGKLSGSAELLAEEVRMDSFRLGNLSADLRIEPNESMKLTAGVKELGVAAFTIQEGKGTLTSANIIRILSDGHWDRLDADASLTVESPQLRAYTVDRATFDGSVRQGLLTVRDLTVSRGENRAEVAGTFRFPEDKPVPQPEDASFTINAPELSAFASEVNAGLFAGRANAKGSVRMVNGKLTGESRFQTFDLIGDEFKAGELGGNVVVDETESISAELKATDVSYKEFGIKEGTVTGKSADLLQRLRESDLKQVDAQLTASLAGTRYRTYTTETLGLNASSSDGVLDVSELKIATGRNTAVADGAISLPKNGSPEVIEAKLRMEIPDLSAFEMRLNKELLNGRVQGDVSIQRAAGQMKGSVKMEGRNMIIGEFRAQQIAAEGILDQSQASNLSLKGTSISSPDLAVANVSIDAKADDLLARTRGGFFENLDANVTAAFTELRYKTFSADAAEATGAVAKRVVTIEKLRVTKEDNLLTANGSVRIPGEGAAPVPIAANYTIDIPDLAAFGLQVKNAELGGTMKGSGAVETVNGEFSGSAEIAGTSLHLGEAKLGNLRGKITAVANQITVEELRLQVAEGVEVAATGQLGIAGAQAYEAAFLAVADNLKKIEPLLKVLGVEKEIGGALDLSVDASGQLRPHRHEGQAALAIDKAKYGEIDLSKVRLEGLFGPEFAEASTFEVVSGQTHLNAGLSWREKKLRVRDIDLQQGTQQVLSGFISVPFEPGSKAGLIPMDQRIAANVNARNLKIAPLLKTFRPDSPIDGTLSANFVAGGTIFRPTLHLNLTGRGITSPAAPKLRAAEIDLVSHYSDRELTLDVAARQPQIQTLTVRGKMPLNLEGTLQQKELDPNLPLDLAVTLPPSSLAVIADLYPGIRSIEGTTAINARISGTVREPVFSGAASLRVGYARFNSPGVPAVGRLDGELAFTNKGLEVRKFAGEVGGGTFRLSGGISVPEWFKPIFALRLESDDVLVRRDDSLTVRVDTDLTATGPLASGAVRGTVWITQSRFFRDIEILPIGLPGRPKPRPAPKSAPAKRGFAITKPPFSDWTFDIAIKTRVEDPFEIRGNLATGTAAADLRFGGTGAEPWLEGMVRVDDFKATLPFSELEVTRGFITFSRDGFLQPHLDIMAQSRLRDYHINAYIYGTPENPQLSLTSEPPLPQQDIISLLATGTTTAELAGGSDVLAGRAAVLVLEQLYRKVFKKRPSSSKDPFLDRFDVDLGAVDSRTGRQEVSATFRLGDNLYLVGDIDVSGEFTGRLRYLIRFR